MLFRRKIKKQFAITIPDPCSEEWKTMRVVDDCHRHCAACDRILTDFSVMSDDELMIFFKQSQGKICGRFRKDQLNRPLTPLAERTAKATWWKAALLLPFSFFSKSGTAQQLPVDSTQTAQLPYMALEADTPSVVPEPVNWNWFDTEERPWPYYEVTGGVPYYFEWSDITCTINIASLTLFDTVITPLPQEAQAGLHPASTVLPVKNSSGAKGMDVAKNFGTAVRKE